MKTLAALLCLLSYATLGADALRFKATVPLPGVKGRFDHFAFDPSTQRLFVAALGNNTVEVLETAKPAHFRSLRGFHEPQGVAFITDLGAVAVANGDTGTLQLIDAATFTTRWTIALPGRKSRS